MSNGHCYPGLPKRNPGLKFANAFSVIEVFTGFLSAVAKQSLIIMFFQTLKPHVAIE